MATPEPTNTTAATALCAGGPGSARRGRSGMPARVDRILQQVERGSRPPVSDNGLSAPIDTEETVHVTASRWWQRRKAELAPTTRLDCRWLLDHVLRHLAHDTTAELDAHRVDTFRGELEAAGSRRGAST